MDSVCKYLLRNKIMVVLLNYVVDNGIKSQKVNSAHIHIPGSGMNDYKIYSSILY